MARGWRVGIDIGGTFTDVIAIHDGTGEVRSAKVRSRTTEPAAAIRSVLSAVELNWHTAEHIIHGTTAITNAIVEGCFARIAFVTTTGFSDTLDIARQNRAHLYRLDSPPKAAPQVPPDLRFEIEERADYKGNVLIPLKEEAIERLIAELCEAGVEAVAVCLIHSYANPAHELALGSKLAAYVPHVILSHAIAPEPREFERASTAILSARLSPLATRYIGNLCAAIPANDKLSFFQSGGGLTSPAIIRERPLALALSGPAAGVAASCEIAHQLELSSAITFDMGGTTTDCCLIVKGRAEISSSRTLAGYPLRIPAVNVESIGVGGGSIARLQSGLMQVGPESAGADPGPACYGLGGREATITDANMVLGHLEDGATLGDGIHLKRQAAESALSGLAGTLRFSIEDTALGVLRVANHAMSRAIRRISVERGVDTRDCVLIAYGGAGPMHAVEVARLLGMSRAIVPVFSSAFSALGCVSSEEKFTLQQAVRLESHRWDPGHALSLKAELEARARQTMPSGRDEGVTAHWVAGMRYAGQNFTLEIEDVPVEDRDALGEAFRGKHEVVYGFSMPDNWEVVFLRLTLAGPPHPLTAPQKSQNMRAEPKKIRLCRFEGSADLRVPEYGRESLKAGQRIEGPALITDAFSTVVLPPSSSLEPDGRGNLHIAVS